MHFHEQTSLHFRQKPARWGPNSWQQMTSHWSSLCYRVHEGGFDLLSVALHAREGGRVRKQLVRRFYSTVDFSSRCVAMTTASARRFQCSEELWASLHLEHWKNLGTPSVFLLALWAVARLCTHLVSNLSLMYYSRWIWMWAQLVLRGKSFCRSPV